MGLQDCKIVLYSPNNTYYPGQTVSGHVEYTFNSSERVRGVLVEFKGAAETSWSKKSDDVVVEHTGKEDYFTVQYYLMGSNNGDFEIPRGSQKYPFNFPLPPVLPSSFEGEYGFVRYNIKATLERVYDAKTETNCAFTVVKHFDLNLFPESKAPLRININKKFCCWCCKSAPVNLDVCLPMSGYCPGQTIPLDISCENGSGVTIFEITIKLKKICTYQCSTPEVDKKVDSLTVTELKVGTIPGHTTKNIQKTLNIPPLPPSNLENCAIIHIEYNIIVDMIANGFHLDKAAMEPIFIGTIPPHEETANHLTSSTDPLLASAPSETPDVDVNKPYFQASPNLGNPPYPTGPPNFQESEMIPSYGFNLSFGKGN